MKTRNLTQSLGKILLSSALTSMPINGCTTDLSSLTQEDCASLVDTNHIRIYDPNGWFYMIHLKLERDNGEINDKASFILNSYYQPEKRDGPRNRYHLRIKNELGHYVFVERFDFPPREKSEVEFLIPYFGDEMVIEVYDPSCNLVLNIFDF